MADTLTAATSLWEAPRVAQGGYTRDRGNPEKERPTLEGSAATWTAPSASDSTRGGVITDAMTGTSLAQQIGSWASPMAADARGSAGVGKAEFPNQTINWPSPMAGAAGSEKHNAAGNSDFSRKAMELADAMLTRWPAPATRDHKGSSEGSMYRQDGKSRSDMLDFAAEQFFHPPSSPGQPIAGGSMSSTDSPNSNQPSARRKLNPIFVEALMRWPTGLSGFERQEMAWTRWWQLMPFFLSTLCSPPPPAQAELF